MDYSSNRIVLDTTIGRTECNTNIYFEIPRHNSNCNSIGKRKFTSAVSTKLNIVCFIMHMYCKFVNIIIFFIQPWRKSTTEDDGRDRTREGEEFGRVGDLRD